MSAVFAVIGRELRLATRTGGDALTLVLFFVMVGAVVPFAIGPDRTRTTARCCCFVMPPFRSKPWSPPRCWRTGC